MEIRKQIRTKEEQQDFGEVFIRLVRSFHQQKQRHAAISNAIDRHHGAGDQ